MADRIVRPTEVWSRQDCEITAGTKLDPSRVPLCGKRFAEGVYCNARFRHAGPCVPSGAPTLEQLSHALLTTAAGALTTALVRGLKGKEKEQRHVR
ncbi:MAG: hypothetical protein LAQ30_01690 [Acidobacteriia bacterium]|nr:hypothetical protein [Terriglobia bacterium]